MSSHREGYQVGVLSCRGIAHATKCRDMLTVVAGEWAL